MKILHATLLFFLLSLPIALLAQDCGENRYVDVIADDVFIYEQEIYANVDPYGLGSSQDLPMDIYVPLNDTLSKRPTIVFVHGGAFLVGWEGQPPIPDLGEYFAKRGYVFVAIKYRLGFNLLSGESAERATYRAVQDLQAALRYLSDYAIQYQIDTSKFILGGTSAGAITALSSAYVEEDERPASTYGIFLEPSDLGCLSCSGNNYNNNQRVDAFAVLNFWGGVNDTSLVDAPHNVPVFSMHGTNDGIVNPSLGSPFGADAIFPQLYGSYPLTERLNNIGVYNEFYPLYGAGHEPELTSPEYLDTMKMFSTSFLHGLLVPQTEAIQGDALVCQGETVTYQVPMTAGSTYCWEVIGGTVLQENNNSITIAWDQQGMHSLSVLEQNSVDAIGAPVSFNVTVTDPVPTASFSTTLNGNDIEVTDASTDFDLLTIDFGDGTQMTTTSTGEVFMHTYTAPGDYTITITAINDCTTNTYTETITIEATTPILESGNESTVFLYPTLAHSTVNIIYPDLTKAWELKVFNALGQLVYSSSTPNTTTLEITGWKSGIYYTILRGSDEAVVLDFLKL